MSEEMRPGDGQGRETGTEAAEKGAGRENGRCKTGIVIVIGTE